MSDPPSAESTDEKHESILNRQLSRRSCLIRLILIVGPLFWIFSTDKSRNREAIRRIESRFMAIAIGDAVMQFYADYRRLPLPSGPPPQDGDRDTDTSPAHGFVALLLGQESDTGERQNTKNTDYGENIKPARAKPGGDYPWRNGLISEAATGTYGIVDYFGNPFRIRLDSNGDQQLANPNPDQAAHGTAALSKRVIVWSAGKDGDWNTWDDNLMSWD